MSQHDAFLATSEAPLSASSPSLQIYSPKGESSEHPLLLDDPIRNTEMTITGKVNPVDKGIFHKVQIVDSDGNVRNVHFSFDVVHDTTMDVAMEMANELHITDWEPFEIAAMIEKEISALVPTWKDYHLSSHKIHPHTFTLEEEGTDNNNSNNDDMSSQSSYGSCNYSSVSYSYANEEASLSTSKSIGSTRFCPERKPSNSHKVKANAETKMSKLWSFMDIRSQLLHKALKQAVHGRRTFKTVGAVEGIGYEDPQMSAKDGSSYGAV